MGLLPPAIGLSHVLPSLCLVILIDPPGPTHKGSFSCPSHTGPNSGGWVLLVPTLVAPFIALSAIARALLWLALIELRLPAGLCVPHRKGLFCGFLQP